MKFSKVHLFGRDFISAASMSELAAGIFSQRQSASKNDFLVTPNAYVIVTYSEPRYHYIRDFYARAAYILPDGMPIVWLSKLKGDPLQSRLPGSDLFPELWKLLKREKVPATLILPSEEMAQLFRNDYPSCNCIVPDFFDPGDETYISDLVEKSAKAIMENESGYVFLGLSFPKQEILAMKLDQKLTEMGFRKPVLFLLLGASYEFYFGMKKRAPSFFRKTGLEWLHRFAQEPGRMWKRYTIGNAKFLWLSIQELIKKRPR